MRCNGQFEDLNAGYKLLTCKYLTIVFQEPPKIRHPFLSNVGFAYKFFPNLKKKMNLCIYLEISSYNKAAKYMWEIHLAWYKNEFRKPRSTANADNANYCCQHRSHVNGIGIKSATSVGAARAPSLLLAPLVFTTINNVSC